MLKKSEMMAILIHLSGVELITSGASTGPQTNTIERLRLEMKKKTRPGKLRSSSSSSSSTHFIYVFTTIIFRIIVDRRWNKHCFPIFNRFDRCLCESSILVRLYVIYLVFFLSFSVHFVFYHTLCYSCYWWSRNIVHIQFVEEVLAHYEPEQNITSISEIIRRK